MADKKLKVINLFAGAGAGKSTTAAGLYFHMKIKGYSVELVTEYAKELTWKKDKETLKNQLHILDVQEGRQALLKGQVDCIITDSPILLGLIYHIPPVPQDYKELLFKKWNEYDNQNFFISRVKPYIQAGRNESEAGAREKDAEIKLMLQKNNITYIDVFGDNKAPNMILDRIEFDMWPNVKT